jgi:hypothetical protein
MTELVVRQTATGSFAIGSFGYVNRRSVFIPRDGIRFSTREAAEAELRAEQNKPTDSGGGVMV